MRRLSRVSPGQERVLRIRIPSHLTDPQLIDGLQRIAGRERVSTAALVAHIAELDRRGLHVAEGFSSLFEYCRDRLRLSEPAAYNRIEVARAAQQHPLLLERLAAGSLSLATARLLKPHLTPANHVALIDAASGLSKRAVEELIATRFPKEDVPPLIRKMPTRAAPLLFTPLPPAPDAAPVTVPADPPVAAPTAQRRPMPLVVPLATDRYQIRFTASRATRDKLRQAQDLLRHAIPDGDPAQIVDRALTALIERLKKDKCALAPRPSTVVRPIKAGSRHAPAIVRRAVWTRDGGRCAFVSRSGVRCSERGLLEFHHVKPFAIGGGFTVKNIELRCRAHNAYESRVFFSRESPRDKPRDTA
jgi:hypothetical protein